MPLAIDPAINMWDQSQWDPVNSRFNGSMPSALPGIQIGGTSSPWTLPLPDPFSFPGGLAEEFPWESALLGESSEPRYVQLGQLGQFDAPQSVRSFGGVPRVPLETAVFGAQESLPHERRERRPYAPIAPRQNAVGPVGHVGPVGIPVTSSLDALESRAAQTALAGHRSVTVSPVVRDDPGLSGQRLKRVLHVKQAPWFPTLSTASFSQSFPKAIFIFSSPCFYPTPEATSKAPIYKYAEWCAHWMQKGGRTSNDPMTPRSELTKSEFDIQYGAWRKALVEGPPNRA